MRIWHARDMRIFSWKYTQFSEFNADDSLLLVSGVHFGNNSVTGEIAVFTVDGGSPQLSRGWGAGSGPSPMPRRGYRVHSPLAGQGKGIFSLARVILYFLLKMSTLVRSVCYISD